MHNFRPVEARASVNWWEIFSRVNPFLQVFRVNPFLQVFSNDSFPTKWNCFHKRTSKRIVLWDSGPVHCSSTSKRIVPWDSGPVHWTGTSKRIVHWDSGPVHCTSTSKWIVRWDSGPMHWTSTSKRIVHWDSSPVHCTSTSKRIVHWDSGPVHCTSTSKRIVPWDSGPVHCTSTSKRIVPWDSGPVHCTSTAFWTIGQMRCMQNFCKLLLNGTSYGSRMGCIQFLWIGVYFNIDASKPFNVVIVGLTGQLEHPGSIRFWRWTWNIFSDSTLKSHLKRERENAVKNAAKRYFQWVIDFELWPLFLQLFTEWSQR